MSILVHHWPKARSKYSKLCTPPLAKLFFELQPRLIKYVCTRIEQGHTSREQSSPRLSLKCTFSLQMLHSSVLLAPRHEVLSALKWKNGNEILMVHLSHETKFEHLQSTLWLLQSQNGESKVDPAGLDEVTHCWVSSELLDSVAKDSTRLMIDAR